MQLLVAVMKEKTVASCESKEGGLDMHPVSLALRESKITDAKQSLCKKNLSCVSFLFVKVTVIRRAQLNTPNVARILKLTQHSILRRHYDPNWNSV